MYIRNLFAALTTSLFILILHSEKTFAVNFSQAINGVVATTVIINEVDADQASTDASEFIELYDGGVGNSSLTGLSIVLYNGDGDVSYRAYDLDGLTTNANGYFVLCGNAVNVANCDLDVSTNTNLIQNGADAVTLVVGDATSYPNGTPVSTTNLIDALVYDTNDGDDTGLLILLNAAQPQVNEDSGTDSTVDSNQRCANGTGGARNTTTYTQFLPTPGTENCVLPTPELLLSEIVVTPTGGEYIEIYNPGDMTVDLTNVYLTDATFTGSDYYYNIVIGSNAGGGGFGDFHAKFPAGAMIAANEYQTISLAGSDDFSAIYGIDPTYELFEDNMASDAIPDMQEAIAGSISMQGGLTNGGEVAVLYYWDGASDLVEDLDYAIWSDTDEAVDKSGVSNNGSMYANDTPIANQDLISASAHAIGESFSRFDLTEGTETQSGGNGVQGDDETSENLSVTWGIETATPNQPAVGPAAIVIINEYQADPSGSNGDANGDGTINTTQDEFFEMVNVSGGDLDVSGWTMADGASVKHTFPMGSIIPDQCSVVVFGGGTPIGNFGYSEAQVASTGSLGLNNSGDSITINNGTTDVASISFNGSSNDNQSYTLDPDITSLMPHVEHSGATGSGGSLFSPGTQINGTPFAGCPAPPPLVVNEYQADPDSTNGDANGDGVAHFSDDEFVELVNTTGADLDVSGWTLSDGVGVRHIFPAGTMVADQCSIVVFGGGAPAGTFGDSVVQTASTGGLGLNNSGDSIVINNGTTDVVSLMFPISDTNQSYTLDPDITGMLPHVQHTAATGSGGSLFSPGTLIDGTQFTGCIIPEVEIFEIQGNTDVSPFAGQVVRTFDNIVTAIAPSGFSMQTPNVRDDMDSDTSNAVFVFTGVAPTVAVGDQVDVEGEIAEFFAFTEFTNNPIVTIDNSSNTLPTAIIFNANTPSPDPANPSCSVGLECFESMLVQMDGTVTSASQSFGVDPIAEAFVVARNSRAFRETGIEFPGLAGLPVWDGNPEIFELDPDKLGLPNTTLNVGDTFVATGVIGFEFGDYELWPISLNVSPVTPFPTPVRAPLAGEMTVASLNMFRFFNDIDDPEVNGRNDSVVSTLEYGVRRTKFVNYIRDVLGNPDIIAVQEVENIVVLNDLADDILADSGTVYLPQLIEGNDIGTIDVGFLVRNTVSVDTVTQLGAAELNTFDNSILHDRPPLLLEASYIANGMPFPVAVFSIHTRSLSKIDDPSDGARVRSKRLQQAQSIATMAQNFQTSNPNTPMTLVGDFNAFEFTDGYVDVVGQIRGVAVAADNLISDTNLVSPPLTNQVLNLPAADRHSFNFRGSSQVLDHALTSEFTDTWVRGFQYGVANADAPESQIGVSTNAIRSSDHDGFVLFMMTDFDADTVPDDLDNCPTVANTDQSDIDMDNLGDACDSCDATASPIITVISQTSTEITGTIEQCAGINSIDLDIGSTNMLFNSSGNPGDTVWTFTLTLIDPNIRGSSSITINGTTTSTMSMVFDLFGIPRVIPTSSMYGMMVLILFILFAASYFRRRNSII